MAVRILSAVTDLTGNPVALMAARTKLAAICKRYWPSVPLSQILAAVRPYAEPLDEDGMTWQGLLAGPKGQTTIDLDGCDQALHIQWYRMDSGNYEVNAYIR